MAYCDCLQSGLSPEEKLARRNSLQIDHELKADASKLETSKNGARVLLLGPANSGKTTVIKQMQILYGAGYAESDKQLYKKIIRLNLFEGLMNLLTEPLLITECFNTLNGNKAILDEVMVYSKQISDLWKDNSSAILSGKTEVPAIVNDLLMKLSEENTLRTALRDKRISLNVSEAFQYLFAESIQNIFAENYVPNEADILHARHVTTHVTEHNFIVQKSPITVIDVSGQRSARLRWMRLFEGVDCVMFLAPIGDYNRQLRENPEINSLDDMLALFDIVCNAHSALMQSNLLLMLNKTDLFDAKVVNEKTALQHYMPDFPGVTDGEDLVQVCRKFIKRAFYKRASGRKPHSTWVHFTHSTDTKVMKPILASAMDSMMRKNLEASNLS